MAFPVVLSSSFPPFPLFTMLSELLYDLFESLFPFLCFLFLFPSLLFWFLFVACSSILLCAWVVTAIDARLATN